MEKSRLKRPFPIPWHFEFNRANPCRQLSLIRSVPVPPSIVGLLAGLGLQMFGHLSLQYMVEDRLQKDRHSPIPSKQFLDLLVRNLHLKGSHRASAFGCWSGSLTTWQNAVAISIQPEQLHNYRDTTSSWLFRGLLSGFDRASLVGEVLLGSNHEDRALRSPLGRKGDLLPREGEAGDFLKVVLNSCIFRIAAVSRTWRQ